MSAGAGGMILGAFRRMGRWRRREIKVELQGLVFDIPGREGSVKSLADVPEVMVLHEGGLVLRNLEIHGAIKFRLYQRSGVMVTKRLAGSAIRYRPPADSAAGLPAC